jgi:hypothetical protein
MTVLITFAPLEPLAPSPPSTRTVRSETGILEEAATRLHAERSAVER